VPKVLKDFPKERNLRFGNVIVLWTLERLYEYCENHGEEWAASSFKSLLQDDYIYEGAQGEREECGPWEVDPYGSFGSNGRLTASYGPAWVNRYLIYYARPNIEAFFFDHPEYFARLVHKLLEKNNEALYEAFVKSVKGTDLDLPRNGLFSWDTNAQEKALRQIDELERYAESLPEEPGLFEIDKRPHLLSMVSSLRTMVEQGPRFTAPESKDPSSSSYKNQFEILKFKLAFLEILHRHDDLLSQHRGYKRFAVNFISLLFTAGIANVICRCAVGNWFFFNKTTSEEKVSAVQEAAGLGLREQIRFK
jgi:hypothetical protein